MRSPAPQPSIYDIVSKHQFPSLGDGTNKSSTILPLPGQPHSRTKQQSLRRLLDRLHPRCSLLQETPPHLQVTNHNQNDTLTRETNHIRWPKSTKVPQVPYCLGSTAHLNIKMCKVGRDSYQINDQNKQNFGISLTSYIHQQNTLIY